MEADWQLKLCWKKVGESGEALENTGENQNRALGKPLFNGSFGCGMKLIGNFAERQSASALGVDVSPRVQAVFRWIQTAAGGADGS